MDQIQDHVARDLGLLLVGGVGSFVVLLRTYLREWSLVSLHIRCAICILFNENVHNVAFKLASNIIEFMQAFLVILRIIP